MILIKIGGGKHISWDYIAQDLAEIQKKEKIIIIHGANARRDELAKELGYEKKMITSASGVQSVYTDKRLIEIFLMSYAGLVNKSLVATLQKNGINAVGLSGIDGRLWEAKWKKNLLVKEGEKTKVIAGSFTGKVEKINTQLLTLLVDNGYTPVMCPPAITYEHEIVNSDNDWAVAITAGAMGIKTIVSLFEAPGMLKNPSDESSIVKHIPKTELDTYLQYAKGTMKKKIIGSKEALNRGAETIYWGDGRIEKPISSALAGNGTIIN